MQIDYLPPATRGGSEFDVEDLADVERGYCVIDAGGGAFYGFLCHMAEFAGGVGALDGGHSIGGVDAMQERGHEDAEEGERNPVAHEVEEDEAVAGFGDVADQSDDVGL